MSETVEERMDREYRTWLDCEHDWLPASKDNGPLTGWYKQCGKCKCWRRAVAPSTDS